MGISSALYSGVSGLNVDSQAMTVIGNNLSNASTTGFKSSSTVFSDLLSSTIYGSGGISQVGRGVQISKVVDDFSQGTFQTTQSGLDCAIEGSGFFVLNKVGDQTDYYTRAGAFNFDANGYLVNPEGLRVLGQSYNADGTLASGDPTAIQVTNAGLAPAKASTTLTLNTNLDSASTEVPLATPFNYTDASTFNYSSSTQVYDSLGNTHLVTVYFRKQDEVGNVTTPPAAPTYTVQTPGDASTAEVGTVTFGPLTAGQTVKIDGRTVTATNAATADEVAAAFNGGGNTANITVTGPLLTTSTSNPTTIDLTHTDLTFTQNATGVVSFAANDISTGSVTNPGAANTWDCYWTSTDDSGSPIGDIHSGDLPAGTLAFNSDGTLASGGTGSSTGIVDWKNGADPSTIALDFNTTQFNSDSVVISQAQDGYASGNLTAITIDSTGTVIASYSNGVQNKISSLVLAKFTNADGLSAAGNNLFEATTDSGTPRVGLPGAELGTIFTDSLEQSNVDTGTEFVNMITVQRAFQANSKIITTVDQMLQDVINMKQ